MVVPLRGSLVMTSNILDLCTGVLNQSGFGKVSPSSWRWLMR